MLSLAVLIAASIAVPAINEVEAFFDAFNYEYDAESYRGAAVMLIVVACASIVYHISMITVRCLYLALSIEKYFKVYGLIVSTYDYTLVHKIICIANCWPAGFTKRVLCMNPIFQL